MNPDILTRLGQVWPWLVARPWLAFVAAALIIVGIFGRDQVLAWRHQRYATGARWLTVAAPPEVTPEAAAAFCWARSASRTDRRAAGVAAAHVPAVLRPAGQRPLRACRGSIPRYLR